MFLSERPLRCYPKEESSRGNNYLLALLRVMEEFSLALVEFGSKILIMLDLE